MTRKKAMEILKMGNESLNQSIMNRKIKIDENGKIIDDSVFHYMIELEERKKMSNQKWLKTTSY
jgi:hypothetical protein